MIIYKYTYNINNQYKIQGGITMGYLIGFMIPIAIIGYIVYALIDDSKRVNDYKKTWERINEDTYRKGVYHRKDKNK